MPLFVLLLEDRLLLVEAVAAPPPVSAGSPAWAGVASLQAALDMAIARRRPLFIQPCTIVSGPVALAAPAGSANRLAVSASPGSVILRQASGADFLSLTGLADVSIDGLIFEGGGGGYHASEQQQALLRLSSCANLRVENCLFRRARGNGIFAAESSGSVAKSGFADCSNAIWSLDSRLTIQDNRIQGIENNGVKIWRSVAGEDGSIVERNNISDIRSPIGTGQNGNGVQVFRAGGVQISGNTISRCLYSAIRVNGGAGARILSNSAVESRECAIFVEAPIAGMNLDGGIVSGNSIVECGDGIKVANVGLAGDGVARRVVVAANQISQVRRRPINRPQDVNPGGGSYQPVVSNAVGIQVEGLANVVGNLIDGAEGLGIVAGTNAGVQDLNITANVVTASTIAIGYSDQAGQIAVTSNLLRGATNGFIVPIQLRENYRRVGTTERVGQNGQFGNLFVASNRGV